MFIWLHSVTIAVVNHGCYIDEIVNSWGQENIDTEGFPITSGQQPKTC